MEWPRERLFNGITQPLTLDYASRKPLFSRLTSWSSGSEVNSIMETSDRRGRQLPTPNAVSNFGKSETNSSDPSPEVNGSTESTFATESVESVPPAPHTEDLVVRQLEAENESLHVDSPCLSNAVERILQSLKAGGETMDTGVNPDFRGLLKSVAEKVKHPGEATRHGVRETILQSRGYVSTAMMRSRTPRESRDFTPKSTRESVRVKASPVNGANHAHALSSTHMNITPLSQSCPPPSKNTSSFWLFKRLSNSKHMKSHQTLFGSEEVDISMSPHFVVGQVTSDALSQAAKASVHSLQGTQSVFPRRVAAQAERVKRENTRKRSSADLSGGGLYGEGRPGRALARIRKARRQSEKFNLHTGDGFNNKGVQTDRAVTWKKNPSSRTGFTPRKSATPHQSTEFNWEHPSLPSMPYTVYYCRRALDSTHQLAHSNSHRGAEWNHWLARQHPRSPALSQSCSPSVSTRPRRINYPKRKRKSSKKPSSKGILWSQKAQSVEA